MLRPKQNSKTEKQIAMENYTTERKKLADEVCKIMNKEQHYNNIIASLGGGATLGLIFGLLFMPIKAQKPVHDENGHVIEYKTDRKEATKSVLLAITTTMLAALAFAEVKSYLDKRMTRIWANELSRNAFQRMFERPLESQGHKIDENTQKYAEQATALILSTMAEPELDELRHFALQSFLSISKGDMRTGDSFISGASAFISRYLDMNTELNYNVLRIMRGDEPRTYFLNNSQKVH